MEYFQAGAFLMHVPTGLFGLVNYGNLQVDGLGEDPEPGTARSVSARVSRPLATPCSTVST